MLAGHGQSKGGFTPKNRMNLEEVAMVFHEPSCPGIVLSDPAGKLTCAECGEVLGRLDPQVLRQIIEVLS